jgi:hypothetical protein
LEHGDDIAHRDQIFDLQCGQRTRHGVETHLVSLERLKGLVGAIEETGAEL